MWRILVFATVSAAVEPIITPCQKLHSMYSGPLRGVWIEEELHDIKVIGAGGLARAEAALFLATIRHALRYNASLDTTEADFCELTATRHTSVLIAPAATIKAGACGPGNRTLSPYTSFSAPPSPPINLHLYAYIPKCFHWRPNSLLKEQCDIFKHFSNPTDATIVIRNESSYDRFALAELIKKYSSQLTFKYFDKDIEFRRELYRLRNSNETFLFTDENLWSDVPNVYYLDPLSCSDDDPVCQVHFGTIKAVRVGDGMITQQFAPTIYKNFVNFSPDVKTLRDILEYEARSQKFDVEEAACQWAIDNNGKFNETIIFDKKQNNYIIMIFICDNDPFNKYYEQVALTTLKQFNGHESLKFNLHETLINCSSSTDLDWGIMKLDKLKTVAGAVAWSWDAGLLAASDLVKYSKIPLKIAGPVSDRIYNRATFAPGGRFSHLTRAYRFFLSKCGWTRLAIISDDTVFSKDFASEIVSEGKWNYKNVVVSKNNIATHLEEFKNNDARIFIVNTNCKLTTDILLQAQNVFAPDSNYIWIVRDWCLSQGNKNISLNHYTIDMAWRGGKAFSGSQKLREDLMKIPNITVDGSIISPGVSYLADALLLLEMGVASYIQKYPLIYDELHPFGSFTHYAKAISGIKIQGVAQALTMENNSLSNPIIYVEKWHGNDRRTMAIWRVANSSMVELWVAMNSTDQCTAILAAARVEDARMCLITSSNKFAPECYDVAVILICAIIIVICIIAFTLHDRSKKHLAARNNSLLAEILENRRQNASALAEYLVKREAITLMHEIGSGCYGRVYFAELNQPGQGTLCVAAKALHENMSTQEENEFLREACVLAQLEHSNVIKLVGVCLAKGPPLMLMEHAIYLDLIRYLTERRRMMVEARKGKLGIDELERVTEADLTRWATEAASALEYLAKRRLVHRDVRAANCLLDKNRSLKLADFGLARELDVEYPMYMTQRKAMFPVLWMAPESLEAGVFGFASDVWALGVLILEIAMMGGRPYGDWPAGRAVRFVINGGCPPLPPDTPLPMRSLLQKCWHRKPEQRITATEIRKELIQNPKIISPTLLLPELPLIPPMGENISDFVN